MEAPHDQHPAPPPQAPPGDRTGADGTGSTSGPEGAADGPRNETTLTVPTADAMRALGLRLAGLLRAGDLVLLTGELGAGKTTLTRGLGEGLDVRGAVTSPTFVIARVHPPLGDGPPLVHVDAYRLGGGLEEMEDLDLDVSLPDSVVVVEWGEGKVEELTEQRLHVVLTRATGQDAPPGEGVAPSGEGVGDTGSEGAEDVRTVTLVGVGPRWAAEDFGALG
ncbi:tRNA (adenosine(37)-N6)-threonylcarbamoyltransferase complex ATPase subunit type 1 TsaE [Streptomyces sp. NPDC006925]|uniref:tRNA (adenosine(37)-N6)-threonylcarbamoyltransferase complex ATPase subunit type 1 TsaE n=2 Tax=unclassified Streptomyces TaxID=2593676 RepID=UPI0036A2C59A